jgi:cephalosporin-C deacetylase-like acetyl esterase
VKAAAARPIPESPQAFEEERARRKKELMRSLGLDPLPPRTPLEARVTGVLRHGGYRVEKVVFESRPGFPVTAHLYVPGGREGERLPVIVNPHGHWRHKKAEPVVQTRAIAQARQGYLALVVDSPGHSFEGDAPIERRFAGPHDDLKLLLGSTNATGIYVWDLMRALDFLETRPEADTSRVGITGASGGGLATTYAFAADERFDCAVPVCYATSLEVNPRNGCLCNHVPATLQIGDRADVLAIRAPAPVFVIGASDDPEFPPEGTRRTGEKLRAIASLLGAPEAIQWRIFESGHDYNREMREAALGFFDLHLRGVGDGSPVPEPEIETAPATSKELLCLAEAPASATTMRDVARGSLAEAKARTWEEVVALNGGLPERTPLQVSSVVNRTDVGPVRVTFESEPGLTIPGILRSPDGHARAALVLVSEKGKSGAIEDFPVEALLAAGFATLSIDVRGFGELPGLDPRLMAYLGTADAFAMGWDAARAAEAMIGSFERVGVIGKGPCGAQVAMFAALMEPKISFVAGLEGLRGYEDGFDDAVPTYSIQPRAAHGAPLSHSRSLVRVPALWHFRGDPEVDLLGALEAGLPR